MSLAGMCFVCRTAVPQIHMVKWIDPSPGVVLFVGSNFLERRKVLRRQEIRAASDIDNT